MWAHRVITFWPFLLIFLSKFRRVNFTAIAAQAPLALRSHNLGRSRANTVLKGGARLKSVLWFWGPQVAAWGHRLLTKISLLTSRRPNHRVLQLVHYLLPILLLPRKPILKSGLLLATIKSGEGLIDSLEIIGTWIVLIIISGFGNAVERVVIFYH